MYLFWVIEFMLKLLRVFSLGTRNRPKNEKGETHDAEDETAPGHRRYTKTTFSFFPLDWK